MHLNETQIRHIDLSWDAICENPNSMTRFYEHLFEIAPETIHFFPDDMSKQSEKLAYTLGFIVGNLDRLEQIKEAVFDLGRFHNRLQIEPYHYRNLKIALNRTFKEIMKESYTRDIEETWSLVLDYLSTLMIGAPEKKRNNIKSLVSRLFSLNNQKNYQDTL